MNSLHPALIPTFLMDKYTLFRTKDSWIESDICSFFTILSHGWSYSHSKKETDTEWLHGYTTNDHHPHIHILGLPQRIWQQCNGMRSWDNCWQLQEWRTEDRGKIHDAGWVAMQSKTLIMSSYYAKHLGNWGTMHVKSWWKRADGGLNQLNWRRLSWQASYKQLSHFSLIVQIHGHYIICFII